MTRADLIAALRAAKGPDRELDAAIEIALEHPDWAQSKEWLAKNKNAFRLGVPPKFMTRDCRPAKRLTASIDAALALVERLLPGWGFFLRRDKDGCYAGLLYPKHSRVTPGAGQGATLPLAILLALFLALETHDASTS